VQEEAVMARKTAAEGPDLVKLAFALAAERGWRHLSFTELARRADVPLSRVYAELSDRAALLRAVSRRLDTAMLDIATSELEGLSPRERVFELIMRRFDAMAPYKEGLRALAREAAGDPGLLAAGLCNLDRLARWLLDAAETGDRPAASAVARQILAAIYARVFRVWLDDDTPDMARTLAELDRRLQQAESLARWTRGLRRGRRRGDDGEPAPLPAAS
jgi:AcrR family transcriptional regulator